MASHQKAAERSELLIPPQEVVVQSAAAQSPLKATHQTAKIQLLLVEDNQETAFMLFTALSIKGYQVQLASSVEEAHEYLKEEGVDIVITDWLLPDGTGGEVCKLARQLQGNVPIIVASAVADSTEAPIMDCYPDALIYKPFKLDKMYKAIQFLLALVA